MQQIGHLNINNDSSIPYNKGKILPETTKDGGDHGSLWQQQQRQFQESYQQQTQKNASQQRFHGSPQIQNEFVEKKANLIHHNEILELNEKVLEKEEAVIKRENEINLYKNEIESLRDECGKIRSKLHAVELYASELQRRNDLITQEIAEKNAIIQELQSADLGLKAQLNIV